MKAFWNKMKRYQRWLLVVSLVAVIVPMLLVAGVLLALRSETGTQWVIDQIPGLHVARGQGSLLGRWQADSLHWQGYGVGLDVDSPVVEWSPGCLFEKRLCVDVIHADHLDLRIQPREPTAQADRQTLTLPTLRSPLGVVVEDVRLGPFTLNGTPVWDRLDASARGSGADWELTTLRYQRDDMVVDASGRVSTRGDWPVAVDLGASLPPPEGDQWRIEIDARGSVADLRLLGSSSGYLDADFEGRVAPLQPDLPLRLELEADRFRTHSALPATLTLKDWRATLEGDLTNGVRVTTGARLPGTEGDIAASVGGVVTATGARDLEIELTGPQEHTAVSGDTPQGTVKITGEAGWSEGLQASADLQLDRFPWYSLLPGVEPPPVALEHLSGRVRYDDGRYQGSLTLTSSGPMGDARASATLTGDLAGVKITEFNAQTGAGSLQGEGTLGFDGPLTWQARLQLAGFNPGYWVPPLQASLDGEVTTRGALPPNGAPELAANWRLTGSWRDQETRVAGRLNAQQGDWALTGLDLQVGQNTLTGNGQLGQGLTAEVTVAFPDLSAFVPQLQGQIKGRASASGTLDEPNGQLELQGSDFAWQDSLKVDTLTLTARLRDQLTLDSDLAAARIEAAGQVIDELEVRLTGTPDDHQLTVAGVLDQLKSYLRFNGRWHRGWDGQLSEGRLDLIEQQQLWRLAGPADIRYRTDDNHLSVGAHCWRWQGSAVCAQDQTLLPEPDIHYRLERFPTLALAPLLPEGVRWQAEIDAELRVQMNQGQPDGRIELNVSPGSIDVSVDDDWVALDYSRLGLSVNLKPDVAELAFNLEGPDLGQLAINIQVDPHAAERPVTGDFSLTGLDLALLVALADLDEVAGELSGAGRIRGPLLAPEIYGDVTLSGGRLIDERIPVPLEAIELGLTLTGTEGDFNGRWRSAEQGQGQLGGHIDWAGEPSLELAIRGDRIPLHYEPYAQVQLSPDLTIAFRGGDLTVSGRVAVPRGSIEVRRLPDQAVSVSADEEIVGVEKEAPALRALNMDVTVVVGEDRVSFRGFGVEGNLEGSIRIGNAMDTRGALQLVDGKYEAYGQELTLRRARLVFVGPISEPYLDIEAIRRVDDVVAGIRLSGPAASPETEVFSEPDMPQDQALSYVILGRPLQDSGEQGDMRQAALSLGLTQASKVTQGLGEELGIRELTLEAEGAGEDASVVASGYITEDLSLRYGVGIFSPTTTVALRYDLGRYFYLEAASGLAASLDIFYTRDF
ncbi:translocation/assembly module TamB domain-containing protein [Marinobacter sp. X15-166B]|uniref:translocation/assembly module TamB domain-containing protein n=1 Tax=Marinobacter sp. X15-166B TaxID=1897620 RepID=UPI00085BF3F4|nr:translocation/assembly module TamB domain-containing protein [Marinobacter sp. X15-166B]OEY67055.1 hypothetical protein BG841_11710 [Marinobacter sp. X15-166B]